MLRFQKLQATGNDFLILEGNPAELSEEQRRRLCDRHFGIGADGIIAVEPIKLLPTSSRGILRMRYWNADGREGTFCGNGARAAAWIGYQQWRLQKLLLNAADGLHKALLLSTEPPLISVQLFVYQIPVSLGRGRWFVHTGSPHVLIETGREDLERVRLLEEAPPLRWDTTHDLGGVNVSFFASNGEGKWKIRTYERGVEAETLSCGTACVALAALTGMNQIQIETKGGLLRICRVSKREFWLIGPVDAVFHGCYTGSLEPLSYF
ncbi:MAG: diaminopimelate epimerase [Bacteroidia bacterium]|nr:diaminopimelate epimerase [Bacteroidia bacterium]MDW8015273.1 diaminopimelate epimerase [Bacteroidia bacterium]